MGQDEAYQRWPAGLQPRPELFAVPVDGLTIRVGLWASPAATRGTVVILPGRTETIEKYAETAADMGRRGFAALALDWRGQGRSSRLLADPAPGHVDHYASYGRDLDAVLAATEGRIPAGPLVLLSHSMGGPIGLRALHDRTGRFAVAVMSTPMLGLTLGPVLGHVAPALARLAVLIGKGAHYAPGQHGPAPARWVFEGNVLTGDRARYEAWRAILLAQPDLALGGVTFGWLDASFRAMSACSSPGFAERIAAPVLLLVAGKDRVVENAAIERFTRRLPRGRLVSVAGAEHELFRESDAIRAEILAAFDRFLADHAI